jgi:hypothetical protein
VRWWLLNVEVADSHYKKIMLSMQGLSTKMNILDRAVAFWRLGDALSTNRRDSTGRGNDLMCDLVPAPSAVNFTMAGNAAGWQILAGRLAKWGKWNRLLTSTEKSALFHGEAWPFNKTTSLRDAKVYYLLNEASGAITFADATGRGNDLTRQGSAATLQVSGPLGTGYATQFPGSSYLSRAYTSDLQSGNFACTIAGWVYLDNVAANVNRQQQIFWGQFDGGLRTGAILYFHSWMSGGSKQRFCADYGDDVDLRRNAVVVADNFVTLSSATWYWSMLEYDPVANTLSLSVNNHPPNTLSPIQQPTMVTGKIGDASRFYRNMQFDPGSGWDHNKCGFVFKSPPGSDLQFGNNAKTVWGWLKLSQITINSPTTTTTVMGIFDTSNNHLDWVIQWSIGLLHFVIGDSAGNFDSTAVPLNDTNWHLFVCWYDKDGDGKIHINLDHGAQVASKSVTVTPATNTLSFVMGACNASGTTPGTPGTWRYDQNLDGILDAVGISTGVPSQSDLERLWNSGIGIQNSPGW